MRAAHGETFATSSFPSGAYTAALLVNNDMKSAVTLPGDLTTVRQA